MSQSAVRQSGLPRNRGQGVASVAMQSITADLEALAGLFDKAF